VGNPCCPNESEPDALGATFSTHFNATGANTDVIEHCLAHVPANRVRAAYIFDDGYEMGLQVLSRPDRPTAVQCLTDDIAAGVIAAANRLKISLPDGLSIAGFDNFGLARKITPALTTAGLPAEDMGEAAALQVIDALEGRGRRAVRTLACNIVMRDSIASAPAA
jgi:DNA-binding LacI/PurR family transcriptional regulator